ncbi:hypothetical protein [Flaviaesturariibacter amylovorans]|uniref:Uncharacterized protein n=1 Tax=Flaviaesturariibacter amylovorans TaxID=1084520 RepID=A0ABP8GHF2_9BACT
MNWRRYGARVAWGTVIVLLGVGLLATTAQMRRVQAQNRQLLLQNDSLLSANLFLRQQTRTDSGGGAMSARQP